MTETKYIAAGFFDDAEKLLEDFLNEKSMEFQVFAEKWRKHNFSLIYACRANIRELSEFTQEIFKLSLNVLKSSSLLKQVGGIYLLYALYRNQIQSPPLRIRITMEQYETVRTLIDKSIELKVKTLHYVISYLMNNSFDFVASPQLMGPSYVKNEPNIDKESNLKIQESDMKHELTEISESHALEEIDQQFNEYQKLALSLNIPGLCISTERYSLKDDAVLVENFLNENKKSNSDILTSSKTSTIRSRRFSIKYAAFSQSVSHHLGNDDNATTSCLSEGIESSVEVLSEPPVISGISKKGCVRGGRKKKGCPKKRVSKDSMSDEELQLNPDDSLQGKVLLKQRQRKPRDPRFSKVRHNYTDELSIPSTSEYLPPKEYLFSSGSDNEDL